MDLNQLQERWIRAQRWLPSSTLEAGLAEARRHRRSDLCGVLLRRGFLREEQAFAVRTAVQRSLENGRANLEKTRIDPPRGALLHHTGELNRDFITAALQREAPSSAAPADWRGPQDALPPSRTVFGRFQLLGELARGAMGVVYRARPVESGEEVALKIMLESEPGEVEIRRFKREALVLSRLKHKGIVRVLDYGYELGRLFYTMEWVRGRDLRVRLSENLRSTGRPGPWEEVVAWMAGVARAVAYCHGEGIVHRDLKPHNILIERDTGRAVLIDFGLLKKDRDRVGESMMSMGGSLTRAGEMVGTPAYMAPEQFSSTGAYGKIGPASDVWGWAASLYHCVAGVPPYNQPTVVEIFAAMMEGEPPRLRSHRRDVPAWLDELCALCLKRKPTERLTMAEVIAAMDQREAPERRGGRKRPKTARSRARRPEKRSEKRPTRRALRRPSRVRSLAPLALIALLCFGLGAVATWFLRRRTTRPRAALAPRERSPVETPAKSEVKAEREEASPWVDLLSVEAWQGLSRGKKEALARKLQREALDGAFEFKELERVRSRGEELSVARFRHLKTGVELHLVPGGRFIMGRDLSPSERAKVEESASLDLEAKVEEFRSLQRQVVRLDEEVQGRLNRLSVQLFASGFADMSDLEGKLRSFLGDDEDADWVWLRERLGLKSDASPAVIAEHLLANPAEYRALGRPFYDYRRDRWTEEAQQKKGPLNKQLLALKRQIETVVALRELSKMSPAHEVRVPPFLIARRELDWEAWERVPGFTRPQRAEKADDHRQMPARHISWLESRRWLEEAGDGLRMPSESEWEYAARAGATTRFPWGENMDPAYAWFDKKGPSSTEARVDKTNLFGLVDVIGNVGEWCADDWFESYAGKDGLPTARSSSGSSRKVVRGGYFAQPASNLHLSLREAIGEEAALPGIGLRVVRGLQLD